MELSFDEVVVLLAADGKDRAATARAAASLMNSTKFDSAVALASIKPLLDRKFLELDKAGTKLSLTRDGHSALLHAIPVVEQIRAALGNVPFRVGR